MGEELACFPASSDVIGQGKGAKRIFEHLCVGRGVWGGVGTPLFKSEIKENSALMLLFFEQQRDVQSDRNRLLLKYSQASTKSEKRLGGCR